MDKVTEIDHHTDIFNSNIQGRNVRKIRRRHEIKPLKYKVPSILELEKRYLTEDEIGFFREHLDEEKMNDQVMEYWQTLFE